MSNHPHKGAVVNKLKYIKMLTKNPLSLRAKNDFSPVRAISWFLAFLYVLVALISFFKYFSKRFKEFSWRLWVKKFYKRWSLLVIFYQFSLIVAIALILLR